MDLELFKIKLQDFKALATEDDLEDLKNVYAEYFLADSESSLGSLESDPPLIASNAQSVGLRDASGGEDIGVDEESTAGPGTLASRLGFIKNGLPHQFNPFRHRMGLTSWSNPSDFEDASSKNLLPAALHWHQLAGVHSIIRHTFTAEAGEKKCSGMLICDEVGLGKTALVIATIAFLNQCLSSERKGLLPPVLGE